MSDMDLSTEIAAFIRQRPRLVADYGASWVIFVGGDCKGHFERFAQAARHALDNYASDRFLIRHTTEPPPQIPFVVVDA